MFFFFIENDVTEELIKKLESFKESLNSNDIELINNKSFIDVICKDYGICYLDVRKVTNNKVSIKINKFKNKSYKLIQDKSQFNKYWKENIPQKEFEITLGNDGQLKKLLHLIIGLRDTFLSDITAEFKIHEISFKDYRRFSDEKFEFNNTMNVLIGKNGCGKTSILEGVAAGIGAFLNGIDENTDSKNIYKKDVRFSIEEKDYMPVRNDYIPTKIFFKSRFINEDITWSRTRTSLENSRTTTKDSSIVTTVVKQLVDDIRDKEEERKIILPVFSYHGVGRVANFIKDMNILEKTEKISRFFGYKDCLKAASNYKFFVNWYRKMKFREFESNIKIPALTAVEYAIKKMLVILTQDEESTVKNLRYFEGEISVEFENGEIVPISYLSDGYKDVIGIASDIAYRMAILNPSLGEEVLNKTPGIVLIDEIEVHLHPKWQLNILRALKEIFPKVQFIITTHSPMIVSSTLENEAIELVREEGRTVSYKVGNPREWYMADILRNVFGIKERTNRNLQKPGETLEDKLKIFSDLVKEYALNKDEDIKDKVIELYNELIKSIPEGNPRRNVLDRLKGLVE